MKFIDRFKKDIETLNSLKTKKEKLLFIWDYYKIVITIILLMLVIGIPTLVNSFKRKAILMYAVLVNSDAQILEVDESVFIKEFENANVDVEGKTVDINAYLTLGMENREEDDIETLQVLNALFSIDDLDVFVGFKDDFDRFIEEDAFIDLSLVMNKDLLSSNDNDLYKYEDSNGNMIIGGVILHKDSLLHEALYYHSDVIIGIASNAENLDNAVIFVSQLLKD